MPKSKHKSKSKYSAKHAHKHESKNTSKKKSVAWESSLLIKDKTIEKILSLKNPQYLALLIVEFFLTLVLVGAIIFYLDGRFSMVEPPFNLFVFAAILYAVYKLYSYTLIFRENRTDAIKRNSSMKITVLEIIIFLFVFFSASLYYNKEIDLFPYPFNFITFLVVLSVPLYFYVKEKFLK